MYAEEIERTTCGRADFTGPIDALPVPADTHDGRTTGRDHRTTGQPQLRLPPLEDLVDRTHYSTGRMLLTRRASAASV